MTGHVYFTVSKPITEQLKLSPEYTLTSERPYLPQKYIVTGNLKFKNLESLNKWRAKLGILRIPLLVLRLIYYATSTVSTD